MNGTAVTKPVRIYSLEDANEFSPLDGVGMRAVFGHGASLNLITLAPGAELALHSHVHEQIGIVIEGVETLVVGGREHHLGPMQAYVIPGGVEHAGIGGPDGCVVLDIFVPTREEYRDAAVVGRELDGAA
ncbi:MAG TPA: cupin domain-containing protein [Solirubrobacterales bacterium]|jgi:quercetin dioxygenase-like cupin family protein|nr:cupin domain-containing protein [Solirubrobacterales bacterium]